MPELVHEIVVSDAGYKVGTDGVITTTLLDAGRMFKRRAFKNVGSGAQEEQCWLVTELNGVRVYQRGLEVIVTTQDLYP